MFQKEIVILANSVKHGQHCVAGKDIKTKEWVRPVADTNGCELNSQQILCSNPHGDFYVRPLQKVKMALIQPVPLIHQPENWLISDQIWVQHYRIEQHEINLYVDNPKDLWLDPSTSTDKVNYNNIINKNIIISQSLYFIKVENLNLYTIQQYEKTRKRAKFTYNNVIYDLAVTDPQINNADFNLIYFNKYLCVSLAGEFKGFSYKIVATVI